MRLPSHGPTGEKVGGASPGRDSSGGSGVATGLRNRSGEVRALGGSGGASSSLRIRCGGPL